MKCIEDELEYSADHCSLLQVSLVPELGWVDVVEGVPYHEVADGSQQAYLFLMRVREEIRFKIVLFRIDIQHPRQFDKDF